MSRDALRAFVVVMLIAALGISAEWATHGSLSLSAPPDDAPYMHQYAGAVTAWAKGEAGLGGWVTNQTGRDCPSMVIWVQSYQMDDLSSLLGPVAVTNGFVAVGVLHAHQRLIWAGKRIDQHGHLAPLATAPLPDPSFDCYR